MDIKELIIKHEVPEHEAVHNWFGLSYSSYMVFQRTVLQSMPDEWQQQFVALLQEIEDKIDTSDFPTKYMVKAKNDKGQFIKDDLANYERGRRKLTLKS